MSSRLKTQLALIAMVAILLISGKADPLMRLTIVNKSGQDIAVRLLKEDRSRFYYLKVPTGEDGAPNVVMFTVVKDAYRMRVIYFSKEDPLTGYECTTESRSAALIATRNIRVTVTSCSILPRHRGEPSQVKMGLWRCIR